MILKYEDFKEHFDQYDITEEQKQQTFDGLALIIHCRGSCLGNKRTAPKA